MSNVLIGVSGGIACYKIPTLCRLFKRAGWNVKVIMTDNAARFITPLTFESVTGTRCYVGEFDPGLDPELIEHIDLAEWADLFIIAPATANTIAKITGGIADNLLTSTVLVYRRPLFVVPAMNTNMLENPMTQENLSKLERLGHTVMEPDSGELACGTTGKGRMPDPDVIFNMCAGPRPLAGKKVIVTAGPTVEAVDPVRFISNHSSGRMGLAVADAARSLGAEVLIIAGPLKVDTKEHELIPVISANDMLDALKENIDSCDILIMAAAVADYAPAEVSEHKIKKDESEMVLKLRRNPDILKELAPYKREGQVFCGFAAESQDVADNALKKLKSKSLDMIVANDISRNDIGFNSADNEAVIYFRDGSSKEFAKAGKFELGKAVLEYALDMLGDDK
ncbi:bifunctional phosphopantothenoylcysteine decarboxylase/phosphopantothenate--cysteine ligase CoaBC [Limisalsivibrio acetivorans]|uniref:bifunctional phosphopantothenoylcysteine decarboxylase/phosphopantothenate--cysteine ligase CoaBC n=1 Tax=Limisalsivibrio acetivorans TaxID=1304888 RepID=UPI0003B4AF8C|nr:bifunctional phosphopantothenoylcysteine decarboxylase/phosphopantothenate--cysteine ligase CoaBC [Limisalsivibrio acetivorans]